MKGGNMKYLAITTLCLIVIVLALHTVKAEVDFNQEPSPEEQALFDQILEPIMTIYNLVKYIATAIAGVMALFAGVTYMTSGSDLKKRETSKNMAMYIVIGLVIIWAAPFVVQLIVG